MAPSKDPEQITTSGNNAADSAPNAPAVNVERPTSDPTRDAPIETQESNGQTTNSKKMAQTEQGSDAVDGGEKRLSGAELKKQKQQEKAARRAKEKAEALGTTSSPSSMQAPGLTNKGLATGKDLAKSQKSKTDPSASGVASQASTTPKAKGHQRTPSTTIKIQKPKTQDRENEFQGFPDLEVSKTEEKRVPLFGHLYGMPRRTHIRGADKDVHPTVLALGLQISNYVIMGASARTTAMMMAFKQVIQSYTTPPGTSLARHLTTHLGHQIDYIISCRPLGIAMGNSIRWLKLEISKVDPSTPEEAAKADLSSKIDTFIRERITVADEVIAKEAAKKIKDGDVILTVNKSYIVQQTLLFAKQEGKKFRVYIVDSRPFEEGKNLARTLTNAGIEVSYSHQHALGLAVREATKCYLGAHAMMSNGRLFSRCGTAMVALMAHEAGCPVIVCCESIKFSERVALDSIVHNEVSSPDELVGTDSADSVTKLLAGMSVSAIAAGDPMSSAANTAGKGKTPAAPTAPNISSFDDNSADDDSDDEALTLEEWRGEEQGELTMLNLMYDLTPAEYIDLVVCEYGNLPPTSVPVVHRISSGQ